MRYATANAFRVALEQRLLTASHKHQVPLHRLRKQVAFDRLLARLLMVAPNRWVVKGGLALELRWGTGARSTKDLDLARQDTEAAATADLVAAQANDLGDFFVFRIERTDQLDAGLEGAAVRYHVTANLDGRRFETAIVDIGFGSSLVLPLDVIQGPDLLGFAGIESIQIPMLTLEQHVAEKLHAYTGTYAGRRSSTRIKDLIDLVLIRSAARLEAGRLRQAIHLTFSDRERHPHPASLPDPPASWGPGYRVLADEVGLDPEVATGYRQAAAFLNPILTGAVADDARWDPTTGAWQSPFES